jgi:S-adenosylmethionine:tRNA ribosyltransferase-isomerase
LKTSDFDYKLPPERIAQHPIEPRDASRLLVIDRLSGEIQHVIFRDIGSFLHPGDLLVINQTRVIPARLYAHKIPTGGRVELLLLRRVSEGVWEALVGGKGLVAGKRLLVEGELQAEIQQVLEGARRLVRFEDGLEQSLERIGHVPLPPYIHEPLQDPERYQTVYARQPGSVAAPTAGLHFTPQLIEALKSQGIGFTSVTLHVGLDTFAPVTEENPDEHKIHSEWCQLTPQVAAAINTAHRQGGRIVAVGTTSVRTLESAGRHAQAGEVIGPWEGPTDLYILPGYSFRVVDALVTNFHLPQSTLIMLVSAFAGCQRILDVYRLAIEMEYRFYSFGDAMLIL